MKTHDSHETRIDGQHECSIFTYRVWKVRISVALCADEAAPLTTSRLECSARTRPAIEGGKSAVVLQSCDSDSQQAYLRLSRSSETR